MSQDYKFNLDLLLNNAKYNRALQDTEFKMKKTQTAAKGLKTLASSVFAGFSTAMIVSELKTSLLAWEKQQSAVAALEQALKNQNQYTVQASIGLQQYAKSLEKVSNFTDQAIIEGIALVQGYAGQVKITKELIKATVDFATANKMDLKAAFSLVGKTISSSTNALSRYGLQIDMSKSKSEKMEEMVKRLSESFGGQAKATADASNQLAKAVDSFHESLGQLLDRKNSVSNFLTWMVEGWTKFIDKIRIANTAIKDLALNDAQTRLRITENRLLELEEGTANKPGTLGAMFPDFFNKPEIERLKKQQAELKKQIFDIVNKDKERQQKNTATFNDHKGLEGKLMSDEEAYNAEVKAAERVYRMRMALSNWSALGEKQQKESLEKWKLTLVERHLGKQSEAYKDQLVIVFEAEKDVQDQLAEIRGTALEKQKAQTDELIDTYKDAQYELRIVAQDLSYHITSNLEQLLNGTKSFGDAFSDIITSITADIAKDGLSDLVNTLLTSLSGGGAGGSVEGTGGSSSSGGSMFSGLFGGSSALNCIADMGDEVASQEDILQDLLEQVIAIREEVVGVEGEISDGNTSTEDKWKSLLRQLVGFQETMYSAAVADSTGDIISGGTSSGGLFSTLFNAFLGSKSSSSSSSSGNLSSILEEVATIRTILAEYTGSEVTAPSYTTKEQESSSGGFLSALGSMFPFFDTGGIVPGAFSQARPIVAHGSEMILNPSQQANLFSLLNSGQAGSGGGSGSPTYVYAPQVSTQADAASVLNVLETHEQQFFAKISSGVQKNAGLRNSIKSV